MWHMDKKINSGNQAETVAAEYLVQYGYKIVQRNWRTRYCEVDIVAAHLGKIWFVEVKYRKSTAQGMGLDYITPKKLKQMHFAANIWVQHYHWCGDYDLAALEVSGPLFQVTEFTEC